MFERYTEKARRVIFFARYEASQFGSGVIESEHLLLGLLRENKELHRWLEKENAETIRRRVEEHYGERMPGATSVDLPLSVSAKRILKQAADEADGLGHKHIGTEHLFLALLDEKEGFAAELLKGAGVDASKVRAHVASLTDQQLGRLASESARSVIERLRGGYIAIHGISRNAEYLRETVQGLRMYNWHWNKRSWTNIDIVVEKKTGKVSLELRLAEDSANFELVKGGEERPLRHLPLGIVRIAGSRTRLRLHQRPRLALYRVLQKILGASGLFLVFLF